MRIRVSLQDILVLDAIVANHLAQRSAAVGSNGLQSGCSTSVITSVEAARQPLAPIQAASGPHAAQHAGRPASAQGASKGPLDIGEHASSRQANPAVAMQPRWQQPMQARQSAVRPGSCGTHTLSGFRDAACMNASVPRPFMHHQQPEQLHYSNSAPGTESAQRLPGSNSAQQGFAAAVSLASCLPSHTSHPPLSRHDSDTGQPPRILWEPGGRPQNAAVLPERPRHIQFQQPQNPAHLKQPAPAAFNVRPFQPQQAAQHPAQVPPYHVQMHWPLQTESEPQCHPTQAHVSAKTPPGAQAAQMHGSMASMLPQSVPAKSLTLSAAAAAAARVQTGDTEEAAKASAEPHQEPMPEQPAPFSIDWDDWHPDEELPNDPAEQLEPLPGKDKPPADVDCVQDSLEDDEVPEEAAGSQPDLTPCKTATKGMQLDRCCSQLWLPRPSSLAIAWVTGSEMPFPL